MNTEKDNAPGKGGFMEKASKTISYALRHRPDQFGLALDKEGWIGIDALTRAIGEHGGPAITRSDIEQIIASSEKKRFEICGDRIRATYGHSFEAKIEFIPSAPPNTLYHGTSRRAYEKISEQGLRPMGRQYVHLSRDIDTALKVGKRHDGTPVILKVNAKKMHADGCLFYHSANDGTWMCNEVPPRYISRGTGFENDANFETISDIEDELRYYAKTVMGTSLQPMAVVFSSLAAHLHFAWKREKAEIEARALEVGGVVEASRKRERDGAFYTPKAALDAIAVDRPLDKLLETPIPLDAAAMRKLLPSIGNGENNGNAAAIREALKNLTRFAESDIMQLETLAQRAIDNDIYGGGILQAITEAIREGKEALSKPPRNCDTLETYNDFVDAWNNHVRSRTSVYEPIPGVPAFLAWLSGTQKKGSAK